MTVSTVKGFNQSIEDSPKKYIKTLTADTDPTGVPIGSELWDAQADLTYITPDGSTWSQKKRAKYENILYEPGALTTGDLESGNTTITATAEGAVPDYTGVMTWVDPSDSRLAVLCLGTRANINIVSDDGTHSLRCRIYVDVQDANHLLYDLTYTTLGSQVAVQDLLAGTKEVIYNLIKDGLEHNFLFFLWSPTNHSPVISVAQVWMAWGQGAGTLVLNIGSLNHSGDAEIEGIAENVAATSTMAVYFAKVQNTTTKIGLFTSRDSLARLRVLLDGKGYFSIYGTGTNLCYIDKLNIVLRSDN